MANGTTYLTRTLSSGADRTKGTFSFWVKRGDVEATIYQGIFGGRQNTTNNENLFQILLQKNDNGAGIQIAFWNSSGTVKGNKRTSNAMRDLSAWYHVVCTIDTTLATADDRIKIYVNGERITNLAGSPNTNPSQNDTFAFFNNHSNHLQVVGGLFFTGNTAVQGKLNGILSHVHACDGYAYSPSDFGSTDATTGEWKINTNPNVTYGNNGFFILKDGNSVTDQSGNSNNFTVAGGTLTKTEDNPSSVFATLNPLANIGSASTYANGNTTITGGSDWGANPSTVATGTTGKYYAECKVVAQASSYSQFGIMSVDAVPNWTLGYVHTSADAIVWSIDYRSGQSKIENNNNAIVQTPTQFSDGDIIGMAIDVDNGKIYFHRNGTYVTYGGYVQNPSSGSYGITLPTSTSGYHIMGNAYPNAKISINFGNGYFGTTAVSSAGTNASNNGIFEYDVPSGFTALSTKGLNL